MRHFFTELAKLAEQLEDMAALVKNSIHKSVLCLMERNADFADQVLRDEALVNQAEIAVDNTAIRLVSLHQPVASDMRLLIAALKINTDLERMGDLAVNISRRALSLIGAEAAPADVPIPQMSNLVERMVDQCITAFTNRDDELAQSVLRSDDEVDRLRTHIYKDLAERMERDPKLVRPGLEYMFIARNLERIADHATNIAEDVIFLVRGADVRHHNEA